MLIVRRTVNAIQLGGFDQRIDTVATTPAGLTLQIRFAFAVFGDPGPDGDIENPDDFTFDDVAEDQQGRLLRSMLAAAEGMAQGDTS